MNKISSFRSSVKAGNDLGSSGKGGSADNFTIDTMFNTFYVMVYAYREITNATLTINGDNTKEFKEEGKKIGIFTYCTHARN